MPTASNRMKDICGKVVGMEKLTYILLFKKI